MKRIFQIVFILIAFVACDEGFEELNENPNAATSLEPGPKLTATILRVSGDRYENWRANLIYSSTMIQHIATTAGYWAGDKYTYNAQYSGAWFERTYNDQVKGIEDLRSQLSAEGNSYPKEMLSIVRILRVHIYSKVSDIYGDVPYSEAGKGFTDGIFRPKYDPQSEIYADMLNELEEATVALGSGPSQFGSADIIFGGDQAKWKKWGNSLMLRLALRMIKVDPAAAQEWATKAIAGGVMTSNEDIAYVVHTEGPDGINRNGNGQAFSADNNPRLSETFVNFLQNDPRLTVYGSLPDVEANANIDRFAPENQRGLPNGLDGASLPTVTGEDDLSSFTEPNRNYMTSESAPMFFQTYAEVEFMLAESAVRWGLAGGDAQAHYNAGVTAAMKYLELYSPQATISDGAVSAYLAENPFNATNALEQINTQYWAATFLNDVESWANWRRTGFPQLTSVNYPGNVTNGTIPRRLRYFEREQTSNAANYQEVIGRQGQDVLTTRMWWDVQ